MGGGWSHGVPSVPHPSCSLLGNAKAAGGHWAANPPKCCAGLCAEQLLPVGAGAAAPAAGPSHRPALGSYTGAKPGPLPKPLLTPTWLCEPSCGHRAVRPMVLSTFYATFSQGCYGPGHPQEKDLASPGSGWEDHLLASYLGCRQYSGRLNLLSRPGILEAWICKMKEWARGLMVKGLLVGVPRPGSSFCLRVQLPAQVYPGWQRVMAQGL